MTPADATWTITKPERHSDGGIVAAQNRQAAAAGAAVLARGGNAMDAAVTTAFTLSVVEPWLSGVGGGGFLLRADGATGALDALDFSLVSPGALDPGRYPLAGGNDGDWFAWPAVADDRNLIGHESICVPGAVAGLAEALRRFGTITLAEALAPAIAHAEAGLAVDWFTSLALAIDAAGLARFPDSAALFLVDGRAPRAPDAGVRDLPRLPMPAKAAMLRRLAEAGATDFYTGQIAEGLVADLRAGGSAITMDDMAAYRPEWRAPLTAPYGGLELAAMPGLSGGPSFLHAMARLSDDPRISGAKSDRTPGGAAALAYADAIRDAYADRLTRMGHDAQSPDPGCTSHISVVDRHGTMVSLTNTLLARFGSKVVAPSAGILMNNGMMWFDPRPNQPNSIKGGVRPLTNMCPLIATRQGRPALAIGAAGGRQIFPALVQLVSYLADFGMSLEQAFHTPRIDASSPTIIVNKAADPTVAGAIARTHPVRMVSDTLYPVHFAIPSAVARSPSGGTVGMAHPVSPWAAAVTEEETRDD
ncbi:gamma-glutamyltransferase [Fodinicurvata sp. EGI_FJ10296]|uniref:gamma-glutamyltransferase family protein n=1 Tax=Fodinicurvata sp. EGI_FJ10296 TaxID=3231908 RepID=UPI0034515522